MNETKNILLKLFILLAVAVGGINSAWAQTAVVQSINATFNNPNNNTNWNSVVITPNAKDAAQNTVSSVAIRVAGTAALKNPQGDLTNDFLGPNDQTNDNNAQTYTFTITGIPAGSKFDKIALPLKGVNGQAKNQNAGIKEVNVQIVVKDGTTELYRETLTNKNLTTNTVGEVHENISVTMPETKTINSGTMEVAFTISKGTNNVGCFMAFHGLKLEKQLTLGNDVNLKFVDAHGIDVPSAQVRYTPISGDPVVLTPSMSPHSFGNVPFSPDLFQSANNLALTSTSFDELTNTLTFVLVEDPYAIKLSPAPTNGKWADGTAWFTIHNNRSNQNGHNYKYLSTAESSVNDNYTLKASIADLERNSGEAWAFVDTGSGGIQIYNAAYGPDFVLGSSTSGDNANANFKMVLKDNPEGYITTFSAVSNSVLHAPSTHSYAFRVGTSGNVHVHVTLGSLRTWNHSEAIVGSNNDGGSSFTLTAIEDFDALPLYDVYKVEWSGAAVNGMAIVYADGAKTFGKRSSANDGDYLIVEKGSTIDVSNFAVTGSEDYSLTKTASSNVAGHAYKALTLTIADALATAKWTVKVNGDYTVSFAGMEYKDGDSFMLRPTMSPQHIDFTVNAPADKFVWGPVIDNYYRTVTFDIRDKAPALETGLYQLALKNEADITKANNLITKFAENVNTSSHYIYLAPSVYRLDGALFKFTGVPTYGGEAATYIYIKKNSDTNVDILSAGGAEIKNVACSFANGEITFNGYGIKNYTSKDNQGTIMYEPKEMPALASGAGPITFALTPISLTAYDSYYIKYAGDYTNSDRFDYKKSSPTGISNYGKEELFIVNKGTTFAADDFVFDGVKCTNVEIVQQPTATDPGELRLTLATATEGYTVRIIGEAMTTNDRVIYHDAQYADGQKVNVPVTAAPSALDFKTNVSDRFVWGPVFDHEAKTVTFEIKTPVDVTAQSGTPLTTNGWYQFMLVPYTTTGENFIKDVNNASNRAKSRKGSYIYMLNADTEYVQNASNHYPLKFAAVPTSGDEATSFLYVKANGQTPQFQAINGHYVTNSGFMSTNPSNMQKMEAINNQNSYGQNIYGIYRWFRYDTGSDEQPYIGASGTGLNYYVRAVKVDPSTLYDVYQVDLTGTNMNTVKFVDDGNHGISEVFNNGYFFLDKDSAEPTKEQFKFAGQTIINSITITPGDGVKTITFNVTSPASLYSNTIIHRQHDVFDRLEATSADMMPGSNYIKKGGGMIDQPYAANFTGTGYNDNDKRIQNTSVFNITQYTKPGTRTECVLPFTKAKSTSGHLEEYQRWYDYTTERPLSSEILTLDNGNSTLGNFYAFANGHCNYNQTGRQYNVLGKADIKLPAGTDEIHVAVDASEFQDWQRLANGNILEPSLNERVIYHIYSAHKMAEKLQEYNAAKPVDIWWEDKLFYVPNIKRGSDTYKNNADLIPLDMPFTNYWIYKTTGNNSNDNLMPIVAENGNYNTLRSNIEIVIEGTATDKRPMTDYLEVGVFDGNPGNIGSAAYINSNHFFYYKVKGAGTMRVIPDGSQAVIKVYAKNGASATTKYQLAKFTLRFQSDSEPIAISNVIGNKASTRSVDYFLEKNFKQVASMTFAEKDKAFNFIPNRRNDNNESRTYAFPIDFNRTSYGYSPSYTFGNYSVTKQGWGIKFQPVALYERNIKNPSTTSMSITDDYFFYIDAAETPGQVASVPLEGTLCAGTRLYCYGWLGSGNAYNGDGNPTGASVVIQLVGRRNNGTEEVLASYLSGTLTDISYDSNGNEMRSLSYGRTPSMEKAHYMTPSATQVGVWNSIGFSFLVSKSGFDSYEMRIINNCFSTAGGDYSLDDFRIFANPPKGDVDFTTPLCSDKVRHAKVHADYDMLRDMSNMNDQNTSGGIATTYCFLDAEIFDNYSEDEYLIKDMFEIDETGNHNLKAEYNPTTMPAVADVINHAFRKALVGSRYVKDEENHPERTDYGFHTYVIDSDYESIQEYAYNDSKNEVIYREQKGDGIRRIVFKEDVVRGEMQMVPAEPGNEDQHPAYWPNLRPSRTYYLVFSPMLVDQNLINDERTATSVFSIHESCSFFGKFTTKDPMHVILDNAEIEADLPMKAICHGESAEFQFDMPALKANKPIYDEEYCTSDHGLDDKIVPSTQGTHHYHYQTVFDDNEVQGVIKNLPYDWWIGGTLGGKSFGGRIEDYNKATHPTITYSGPKDIAHKQDNAPVNLAQAMTDFRFYYPDFGMGKTDIYGKTSLTADDFDALVVQNYNADTGYGLLRSEINTIKDFVLNGLLILHRNTYDMPLTLEKSDKLTLAELTDMTESELSNQILELAIQLEDEQLKALESSVLNPDRISKEGRVTLSFEVFYTLDEAELRGIAPYVLTALTTDDIAAMTETELHKAIEDALKKLSPDDMLTIAENNFPNLKHEERAYLVIRALNVMSREALAKLTEDQRNDNDFTRQLLREKMIAVFADLPKAYLLDMWNDAVLKLPAEDVAQMLNGETAEDMDAQGLATLVEGVLARITNNIVSELNADRFIHFTLVPIQPSQEFFVDEPYIFCPEPRGVKIRVTTNSPRMLDGFADMPYPDDMDNVPVRLGLSQIAAVPYSDAQEAKTLRVPLRKLGSAQKNGTHEMHLQGSGYVDNLYLVETNDPDYQYGTPEAGTMKPAILVEGGKPGDQDAYRLVAKVKQLQAVYTSNNNFMDLQFDPTMKFREGYTYRLGFNFMEFDQENAPTISCYGTMFFDMKIVPEYQKWTGAVSNDWTNDANWQRADRSDLHADSADASVSVALADATDIRDAGLYATNDANNTSESFIPMAFTNTLIAEDADRMPQLYSLIAPQRGRTEMVDEKEVVVLGHFLGGSDSSAAGALLSSASDAAKYDMEVYDATGAWHAADNYECGLFGTYVAKGITFEPATSLYNAQLLTYQKAWVEYALSTNRWYTIASPLQETFSGEWYSPTGSGDGKGKQLTPHFYGITYQTKLNNRFNPAYYQRSWDQGTAKMFRCYDANHNPEDFYMSDMENKSPLNVALALDWSHVYNDVEVNYSNGGFSVKPAFDDDSEGQVLVRMPKADTSYLYFDEGDETDNATHRGDETSITRGAGHYRLISDKLATTDSFTQSITNANGADNPYYLVANPFMAPMDMTEFFTANPQFEAGKFWIMTNSLQEVNMKTANGWISTTGDGAEGAVAPLQAFFVKLATPTAAAVNVTYNKAMQKTLDANATVPVLKAPARKSSSSLSSSSSMVFRIEATGADGALQSQAAVVFSETADNAFRATEDAELLLDGNTAEEVATVFTTAPTAEMGEAQAMQFNALSRTVTTIPLGVIAPTADTETTLTFSGISALAETMEEAPYLYDAANGSFTVLDEETTLTVEGTSAGRYFIVSGMHMPYDDGSDIDNGEPLKAYNLHGIRVATPQRGTVTIRGSRKEFNR